MTKDVFTTGRKTLYRGIEMRSRLEARFAATLESLNPGCNWEYEPRCYASASGQWLPDFEVDAGDPERHTLVEVKPTRKNPGLFQRMSMAWETDPAAVLQLAIPDGPDRWSELHWTSPLHPTQPWGIGWTGLSFAEWDMSKYFAVVSRIFPGVHP